MSDGNGESPEMRKGTPVEPSRRHIGRRELLAATAAGAVLLPEAASANAAVSKSASTPGQPAGGPSSQELQRAVDDWAEPWVWRPHDWPGQQLHLNVVGHASPGPTVRMRGDDTLFVRVRNMLGPNDSVLSAGKDANGKPLYWKFTRGEAPVTTSDRS
ncbi:MAG: hypothetical protein GY711_07965 [bacterium]|nr:hypothetical protein [bacterium]